jgi:hypothetical protein
MEEERRRWDQMGAVERAASVILNDVLPFSCPQCQGKLEYDKGCMAMHHGRAKGGCGARFCALKTEAKRTCTWRAAWPTRLVFRGCRSKRTRRMCLRKCGDSCRFGSFTRLEDVHRAAVLERVRGQLKSLGITDTDVLGK